MEKVRERMRKEEEEEISRKKIFLERWKEKEERKRRQKAAEEGWKRLMESISEWEELILVEENEEEATEMEMKILTEEGFGMVGQMMEGILEEVIAFKELEEEFGERAEEMKNLELEMIRIEKILEEQSKQKKEKEEKEEGKEVYEVKISTRRKGGKRSEGKRKEMELQGANEETRLQRRAMRKMFSSGKLRRGPVPPTTATSDRMGGTSPPIPPDRNWNKNSIKELLRGT